MHKKSRLNIRIIISFVLLMLLAYFILAHKEVTMRFFRKALEWKYLKGLLWSYIIITMGFDYVLYGRFRSLGKQNVFGHFKRIANVFFTIITYGFVSTTSVSLLKGVYIQEFFGDVKYFLEFSEIDIYSILIVCSFLFGYSLFQVTKVLVGVFYFAGAQEAVPYNTPIEKDDSS